MPLYIYISSNIKCLCVTNCLAENIINSNISVVIPLEFIKFRDLVYWAPVFWRIRFLWSTDSIQVFCKHEYLFSSQRNLFAVQTFNGIEACICYRKTHFKEIQVIPILRHGIAPPLPKENCKHWRLVLSPPKHKGLCILSDVSLPFGTCQVSHITASATSMSCTRTVWYCASSVTAL